MPPKSATGAKKKSATAKKKVAAVKASPVVQNAPAEDTAISGSKRGRAESAEVHETRSKKTKTSQPVVVYEIVDSDDEVALAEPKKPRELDSTTQREMDDLKKMLADHTLPSMTAIMDAIKFEKTRPETFTEMIEAVLEELETRVLAGQNIENNIAAMKEVDEKYEQGEYDVDPEGFDKDVRRRLKNVEDMVGRLTKMYLKDIIKKLGSFAYGGTNAALAAQIVAMLTCEAQSKSQIVREYKIVKSVYRSCYGCCGEDSGLDGGNGVDSEGDEEDDCW